MKQKIILLCLCLVCTGRSTYAQWVVSDPTNLAQGIVNSTKQVVEAAKNGSTMLQSFQETVKIYEQGKRYYDALKSVSNLVRSARKVQQCILLVGEISDIYVDGYRRMVGDENFTPAELAAIAAGYARIIEESDHMGKIFFKDLYGSLKLNVCEYTFEGHDEVVAYSLSVPFASTLVFASIMKHQDAPGTTFKKHMAIARGLLSEDDYLLTEILFNPKTPAQIDNIVATLTRLSKIIDKKDSGEMKRFLDGVRKNLE